MSLFTQAQLCPVTVLSGTVSTLYTVPTGKNAIVKSILIANKTSTDKTITMYFVPSAGTAGTTNIVFGEVAITANSTELVELSSTLAAGTTIQALASSSASINIHISGVEVE